MSLQHMFCLSALAARLAAVFVPVPFVELPGS